MSKIKQICEDNLKETIVKLGYELVDVAYVKENGSMSLIFTIDRDEGVSIDDCEIVSKKIDPILEELNPTDDKPYTLVVSSPGLDRPLKTDRDLKRVLGQEIEVVLFAKIDGKKIFQGVLDKFDEQQIVLKTEKDIITLQRSKIGSIKLVLNF